MTATLNTNGKAVRKSLAEQIDRLDHLLDGLADNIDQTVTSIVHGAIKEAVQAAITEVLTNAELHKHLRSGLVIDNEPDQPAVPSFGAQTLKGWFTWVAGAAKAILNTGLKKISSVCAKVAGGVKQGWNWVATGTINAGQQVVQTVRRCWARLVLIASLVKQLHKPVLVSLGVGTVVGLGCYLAGPVVAATISGFSSAVLAWVGWMLRYVWRLLGLGAQEPDGDRVEA